MDASSAASWDTTRAMESSKKRSAACWPAVSAGAPPRAKPSRACRSSPPISACSGCNAARMEGRTRCNKIVVFEGGDRFVGQVMDVEIESTSPTTLYGNPAIINLN